MDRLLPWYINGHARHPYGSWLKVAILNALTLAIYTAAVVASGVLVWKTVR